MFRFPDIPVLATPEIFATLKPQEWLCQFKYNGWRCQLQWDGTFLHWVSRHNKRLDTGVVPPELAQETAAWARRCPPGTIFDCELLARRADKSAKGLVVFDLIQWAGNWLGADAAAVRWRRLREVVESLKSEGLAFPRLVESHVGDFKGMFEASRQGTPDTSPTEGVVLKRLDSIYLGSVQKCAENPGWLKVKWLGGDAGKDVIA